MSGIDDIIVNTVNKDFAQANDAFNDAMQGKVNDSLDQHMAHVAQVMSGQASEDEFPENIELSNDDIDDLGDEDDED